MSTTRNTDSSTTISMDLTSYTEPFTSLSLASSSPADEEATSGGTITAQDYVQLTFSIVGLVANAVTLIVLFRSKKIAFSKLIKLLLKHQTICDFMVCLLAIPIIVQPFMWKTNIVWLDVFLCHIWHSQVLFWSYLLLSIWNLVLIAIERHVAVCFPLRHVQMTKRHIYFALVFVYTSNYISCIPMPLDMSYNITRGICTNIHLFKGTTYKQFLRFYGPYWFTSAYVVPLILFFILYGQVLRVLHKRRNVSDFQIPSVIDQANAHFTKTVIIVTIVFFIAISFDPWYYFLASVDVVVYQYGTPFQKIGLFMNVFNSFANPFIYVSSMPQFRQAIREVFSGKDNEDNSTVESSLQSTPASSHSKI